jgi:hypothetical protein
VTSLNRALLVMIFFGEYNIVITTLEVALEPKTEVVVIEYSIPFQFSIRA